MPSLQTFSNFTISSNSSSNSNIHDNNPILDFDTFKLIRDMCIEFHLTADIEFTCYESYTVYLQRYFCDLERRIKQTTAMQHNNNCSTNFSSSSSSSSSSENGAEIMATNDIIGKLLDEVEKTSLLHVVALISICAKYINGFRSEKLIKKFSTYLQCNGTPYTMHEIRNSEYVVFKCLAFNIKPSGLYSITTGLAQKIINPNCYERLHSTCITLLRFIYLYRKRFDEILHHVEETTYGFIGNEETKFAAVTVYVSTMLSCPLISNNVLNEIVRLTYLNESFLRKFGHSIHDFYLDYM